MLNFYRHFIAGVAGVLRPLTDALRATSSKLLDWSSAMETAFTTSKDCLDAVAELAHRHPHLSGGCQQQPRGCSSTAGGNPWCHPPPPRLLLEEIRQSGTELICFRQGTLGPLPGHQALQVGAGGETLLHAN